MSAQPTQGCTSKGCAWFTCAYQGGDASPCCGGPEGTSKNCLPPGCSASCQSGDAGCVPCDTGSVCTPCPGNCGTVTNPCNPLDAGGTEYDPGSPAFGWDPMNWSSLKYALASCTADGWSTISKDSSGISPLGAWVDFKKEDGTVIMPEISIPMTTGDVDKDHWGLWRSVQIEGEGKPRVGLVNIINTKDLPGSSICHKIENGQCFLWDTMDLRKNICEARYNSGPTCQWTRWWTHME